MIQHSNYLLNICNELTDRMDLYYLLTHDGSDDDRCAAYTYLVKDVEITIEVTFNDGTTASRTLGLFANQYLATDKMADGTEYTYNAMQIFCYDINNADDATKQLISNQITRAEEICKTEEAKSTGEVSPAENTDNSGVDDNVGTSEET